MRAGRALHPRRSIALAIEAVRTMDGTGRMEVAMKPSHARLAMARLTLIQLRKLAALGAQRRRAAAELGALVRATAMAPSAHNAAISGGTGARGIRRRTQPRPPEPRLRLAVIHAVVAPPGPPTRRHVRRTNVRVLGERVVGRFTPQHCGSSAPGASPSLHLKCGGGRGPCECEEEPEGATPGSVTGTKNALYPGGIRNFPRFASPTPAPSSFT